MLTWYNVFTMAKKTKEVKEEIVEEVKVEELVAKVNPEYDPSIPENKQRWLR